MSQKSSKDRRRRTRSEGENRENMTAGGSGIVTRKRAALAASNEDEHPARKIAKRLIDEIENDENKATTSKQTKSERRASKRKATVNDSGVLGDISSLSNIDDGIGATSTPKRPKTKSDGAEDSGNGPSIVNLDADVSGNDPLIIVSDTENESIVVEEKEPKGINDIEDTNIVQIMQNLPQNDRLNLAATSTRFNHVLTHSPNKLAMKLLTLDFTTPIEEFPSFTRTYREVLVRNLPLTTSVARENEIIEVFNRLRGKVTDLRFLNARINLQFFNRILSTMPDLESIALGCSTAIEQLNIDIEPLPLPKMKKITINGRNIEAIAKIIRNVTTLEQFVFRAHDEHHEHPEMLITDADTEEEPMEDEEPTDEDDDEPEIAIDDDGNAIEVEEIDPNNPFAFVEGIFGHAGLLIHIMNSDEDVNYTNIKEILMRQPNLKTLEINDGSFFETAFDDVPFQLKDVTLFIKWASTQQLGHMYNFLRTQTQIESIVINVLSGRNALLMNDILRHSMRIPTMRVMKIVFYDNTGIIDAYRNLRTINPNVQDLYLGLGSINRNVPIREMVEQTRRHFPNIKKLDICLDEAWRASTDTEALEPLNQLEQLEDLTIENVNARIIEEIHIPSLRRVVLKHIRDSPLERWERFLRQNNGIEDLYVSFRPRNAPEQPEIVAFIRSIEFRLPRIKKVHICGPNLHALTDAQKDRIKEIVMESNSMKTFGSCGWSFSKT